jgi:membrane fusion protein (multidrug efflux system)
VSMPMSAPSRRRWIPVAIVSAVVLSVGAFVTKGPDKAAEPPVEGASAAIPVVVRAVGHVGRPGYVALSGDVEGRRMASVGFLVPGKVAAVGPKEGDFVREGAVLATLDPRDYELHLELAAAQRARAEDEYGRAKIMFAQKGIAPNDFNKAEIGLRMARAQEAMAAKKVEDTKLVSPLAGVVARRAIEPGEQAGPGYPIFTIVQIDPVQVRAGVPEAQIGRIAVGQKTTVVIPSLGNRSFQGHVRVVGVAADPASRTYTAKVEIANKQGTIKPGMIAEIRIEGAERVNALTLPAEAIVRDAAGVTRVYVYNADDKRVYARRVDVGQAYGQEVEVRSGLSADEKVVIGGQHRVREGSLVNAQTETDAHK